ncbi:hypothetical protein BG004_001252 [Podila humilis]|nr:hypothetical protein BG004_001252 [Podila humilis]
MTQSSLPVQPRRTFLASCLVFAMGFAIQQLLVPRLPYYWSNLKNVRRPLHFHGRHIANNFFEGWYFKFTNDKNDQTLAVIAGVHIQPMPNSLEHRSSNISHAFVMVLGLEGKETSAYFRFPREDFVDMGSRASGDEHAFKVKIGSSLFSHDELVLDLPSSHFERIPEHELEMFYNNASLQYLHQYQASEESKLRPLTQDYFRGLFPSAHTIREQQSQDAIGIKAHFQFATEEQTPLPTSVLVPSIMGFTAYLPFLECIHGVASLYHPIQTGEITIHSAKDDDILSNASYVGGIGYLEKDWGMNFPATWIWAQTNIFKSAPGSSLLFSLASIPLLGPGVSDWVTRHLPFASGLTKAPGMLLVYYHSPTKTLYNFSTYMPMAKIRSIKVTLDIDNRTQTVSFTATTPDPNNFFSETIELEANFTRSVAAGTPLRTPSRIHGRMSLGVEEAISAHSRIRMWRVGSGEIVVEDEGTQGGLEVEGNVEWLEKRINRK